MNELETRLREMLSDSVAGAEPRFTAADVRRRSRRRTCRLGAVGSVVAVLVILRVFHHPAYRTSTKMLIPRII